MSIRIDDGDVRLHVGDCIDVMRNLPSASIDCCVTSPPYWGLRDYGVDGQIGLESTLDEFVDRLVAVFDEVRRLLTPHGTLWVNLGDSYAHSSDRMPEHRGPAALVSGSGNPCTRKVQTAQHTMRRDHGMKPKDLVGAPWMVAFALRAAGWWLRADVIWAKPNPMPESVRDRPTKSHEYLFLLSKSERYYFDADAIKEPAAYPRGPGNVAPVKGAGDDRYRTRDGLHSIGPRDVRNARTVWTIASQPYPEAHFAVFPEELPRRCILAGCPEGGTVLDPFAGSGTTLSVARKLGRRAIGIEMNAGYADLAADRLQQLSLLGGVA